MAAMETHTEQGFALGDLRGIIARRLWWFLIPSGIGLVAAAVLALSWPAEYESAAIVGVEPQDLPEALVNSTVVGSAESRYGQIRLRTLARDNLSEIIDQFELFAGEKVPREELVERLRAKISIEPLPPAIVDPRKPIEIQSFRIAFRGAEPKVIAEVAQELTRDFLAANLEVRAAQAEGASQFIDRELARTELERAQVGAQIAQYKRENVGMLPENLQNNTNAFQRLNAERRRLVASRDLAQTHIGKIQKRIEEVRASGTSNADDPVRRKKQIELLLNRLKAEGLTAKHPDVVVNRTELAELEALIAESNEEDRPLSGIEAQLRRELRNHEVTVAVVGSQLELLDEKIEGIKELIEGSPERADILARLETAFDNLSKLIAGLRAKKAAADIGLAAELGLKGEKFRVYESAVAPSKPISPNRPLFFVVGTVLGLMLGLFLLIVREMTDGAIYSVTDLQDMLNLPVLGTIPLIRLPAELARARARIRRLAVAGGVVLALAAGGTVAFYLTQGVLRSGGEPGSGVEQEVEGDAQTRLWPGARSHV